MYGISCFFHAIFRRIGAYAGAFPANWLLYKGSVRNIAHIYHSD
jgi:hypothetical protein